MEIPLSVTDASFNDETNMVKINFQDVCPPDHPDPMSWMPTKHYSVELAVVGGIIETPIDPPPEPEPTPDPDPVEPDPMGSGPAEAVADTADAVNETASTVADPGTDASVSRQDNA